MKKKREIKNESSLFELTMTRCNVERKIDAMMAMMMMAP